MAPQLPPPDEQEYDAPQMLGTLPDGQLDLYNNPFWYFTNSPWFDPSSQNISLFMSCQRMPNGQQVMNDRKLWHERLHEQGQGSRFVIVGEPQAEGQPWVIQRQNKTENEDGETETFVEGNWYFQGTKILMAPSVYDVVQSRLLSISTRMQQIAELSKKMTHWSPSTGYSGYPPSYDAKATTTASRIGSPTLAPTDPDVTASQALVAAAADQATGQATASTEEFSDALFMHSLQLTNRYGDEYMDENPLKGEPGAFVFENTRGAVDARNKAQQQAAQASLTAAPAAPHKIDTSTPSVVPSAAQTPKGAATPLEGHNRKGSIAPAPKKDKKKRKQSIPGVASPTTPAPGLGSTPAPTPGASQ